MFVDFTNVKHLNMLTFDMEDQNSFSFLEIKIIQNTKKNHLKHQFIANAHIVVFLQTSKNLSL